MTNRIVLTDRQANLLATAIFMLASAAQPSRQEGYVFDEHVAGWFNRCLTGTRTAAPAAHDELMELYRLLNEAGVIVLESAS